MAQRRQPELPSRIEITCALDRQGAEALRLEILRLAKRHGIGVEKLRVEPVAGEAEET